MLDVVSLSPAEVGSLLWRPHEGAVALTVVCKATFELAMGETRLCKVQDLPSEEDSHWNDDPARSLQAASDFAPFKPRADVMLVGDAFAPGGQPARAVVARLVVGAVDKSIEVTRDRFFDARGELVEGKRFTRMPLRYERAAGGANTLNPVGLDPEAPADAYGRLPVPNLLVPGTTVSGRGQRLEAVGFGPIAPSWPSRRRLLGRHAAGWDDRRWHERPLPSDLDPAYFNAAPADQQIEEIRPNERLVLENLHASEPRLVCQLPGARPRAFVEQRGAVRELAMRGDTLWIDTRRGVCTVTWRGRVDVVDRHERGRVLVALETPSQRLGWPQVQELARQTTATRRTRGAAPAGENGGTSLVRAEAIASEVTSDADPANAPVSDEHTAIDVAPARSALPFVAPPRAGAEEGRFRGAEAAPPLAARPAAGDKTSPSATALEPALERQRGALGHTGAVPIAAGADLPQWVSAPRTPVPPPQVPQVEPLPAPPLAARADFVEYTATTAAPPPTREPAASPWAMHVPGAPREPDLVPPAPQPAPLVPAAPIARPPEPATRPLESRGDGADGAALDVRAVARQASAPEIVELVWFDPDKAAGLRRTPAFAPLLAEIDRERMRTLRAKGASYDEPPPPEESPEARTRRDVLAVMARAPLTAGAALAQAMLEAVDEAGCYEAPLVLMSGRLFFPFDELETLKATVTCVTPLVAGNKALKETLDTVSELLQTPWLQSSGEVAEGLTEKVREAFKQGGRVLDPSYLDEHTERILLEQRAYQKRMVFGEKWIRALLTPGASKLRVPTYIPESLAKELPMFTAFQARVIAEAHVQQDQYESHDTALKTTALGRVVTLRG
jgi:hypothetical protein